MAESDPFDFPAAEPVEVRVPEAEEMPGVQVLRHKALDPDRKVATDLELTAEDFDEAAIHMAAFVGHELVSSLRMDRVSEQTYIVRKVATAEDYRHRGLAAMALAAAEAEAVSRGAREFMLNSRRDAMGFYAKQGYTATGIIKLSSDGIMNYSMTKKVN